MLNSSGHSTSYFSSSSKMLLLIFMFFLSCEATSTFKEFALLHSKLPISTPPAVNKQSHFRGDDPMSNTAPSLDLDSAVAALPCSPLSGKNKNVSEHDGVEVDDSHCQQSSAKDTNTTYKRNATGVSIGRPSWKMLDHTWRPSASDGRHVPCNGLMMFLTLQDQRGETACQQCVTSQRVKYKSTLFFTRTHMIWMT